MTSRGAWRALAVVATVLGLLLMGGGSQPAAAHPLGNFTTNQYGRIEVTTEGLRLVYVLDLAEIPAFQEIQARIDTDGDGEVGDAEREVYLAAKLPEIAAGLRLTLDDQPLALRPVATDLSFPEGQAGLKLLRLRVVFDAPVASAAVTWQTRRVAYRTDLAADRLGWREVVVTHGAGIRLDGSDAPLEDVSDELRAYPEDQLSSPLGRTTAAFTFVPIPGEAAAAGFVGGSAGTASPGGEGVARPSGGGSGGRFAALVTGEELTALGVVGSLLAAMAWGAAHALSPGHGKTVVGAYLIGSRGTARHALFLGATVTVTHTAGVLALGLVTLFASRYVLPEDLYPWMSLISGVLVVGMGLLVLRQRALGRPALGHHHHEHGHDHDHAHSHDHDLSQHEHGDRHHHDDEHAHAHAHGLPHEHTHDQAHEHREHARDHQHDLAHAHTHSHGGSTHSHLPPGAEGTPVTWRNLATLGISGGLIPCPSALVVLLGSIALGRVGFGLVLVLAFSLGLAGALTAVGLLFLHAGRLLERRMLPGTRIGTALRYAPVVGAGVLTLAGVVIVVRALNEMRFG